MASSTVTPCSRHALEIELRVHEIAVRDALGDHRLRAGKVLEQRLDVLRDLLDDARSLPLTLIPTGV